MSVLEQMRQDYRANRREIGEGEFDLILAGDADIEVVFRQNNVIFVGADWLYVPKDQRAVLQILAFLGCDDHLCENCRAATPAVN